MKPSSLTHPLALVIALALVLTVGHAQFAPALDLKSAPNGVELRWQNPAGGPQGRLPTFQLESSEDLKRWSELGAPIRSVSPDELHLRTFANDRAGVFYRLLARYESSAKASLGSGGAEVFGYGAAFAAELAKLGQITPEQFAARYPNPTNYLDHVSFDVTEAKFYQDFNSDPEVVNAGRIPVFEPVRLTDFRLNTNELTVFKKNGFVVSERLAMPSFADQFYRIWKDDMPVFISTDAILHAWHRTYDAMLEEVEETFLFENLDRLLDEMAGMVSAASIQIGTGVLKDSLLDADYFLTVARSLLKGTNLASGLNQDGRVVKTLTAIRQEEPILDTCFNLFGVPRAVDFSQFKVRGHYENSPRLRRYFQSVMWLGRTDLRLAGGPFQDSDCAPPHPAPPRELGTAVVLSWLLNQSEQFERWRQFDQIIQTFVGWTDSATFAQLNDLLRAAKITALTDLPDMTALLRLQDQIAQGQIGVQNIRSDYFISPLGPGQVSLPRSFTVFGQKFVPDSWALAQNVFDSILWVENGVTNKVRRRVPSALDVAFSTLGNNQTVPELVTRLNDHSPTGHPFRDGYPYQHNLAAVRGVIDDQGPAAWESTLYMDWLGSLRELSMPLASWTNYPQAFRTRAWAMKSLNTQLASWSQLRHDTILYAKQSYTAGGDCAFPAVLVEPHPTFWKRMLAMVERTSAALAVPMYEGRTRFAYRPLSPGVSEEQLDPENIGEADLGAIRDRQLAHLARFRDALRKLETLASAQLEGRALSTVFLPERGGAGGSVEDFACNLIQRLTPGGGSGGVRTYTGWYPQLFYRSVLQDRNRAFDEDSGVGAFDAIVADVHTDVPDVRDPGSVLHEGIGPVNMAFITAEFEGTPIMFAGPVLSHFEFELIGAPRRLSDSDWRSAISMGPPVDPPLRPKWRSLLGTDGATRNLPPPPSWTKTYLVPSQE